MGDSLSPLLFIMAMIPLSYILRRCYKFTKSQEKIYHLMYIDDIKLFSKKEKELVPLMKPIRICGRYKEMEFCVDKGTMLK